MWMTNETEERKNKTHKNSIKLINVVHLRIKGLCPEPYEETDFIMVLQIIDIVYRRTLAHFV